jgi:hypothetical protein
MEPPNQEIGILTLMMLHAACRKPAGTPEQRVVFAPGTRALGKAEAIQILSAPHEPRAWDCSSEGGFIHVTAAPMTAIQQKRSARIVAQVRESTWRVCGGASKNTKLDPPLRVEGPQDYTIARLSIVMRWLELNYSSRCGFIISEPEETSTGEGPCAILRLEGPSESNLE